MRKLIGRIFYAPGGSRGSRETRERVREDPSGSRNVSERVQDLVFARDAERTSAREQRSNFTLERNNLSEELEGLRLNRKELVATWDAQDSEREKSSSEQSELRSEQRKLERKWERNNNWSDHKAKDYKQKLIEVPSRAINGEASKINTSLDNMRDNYNERITTLYNNGEISYDDFRQFSNKDSEMISAITSEESNHDTNLNYIDNYNRNPVTGEEYKSSREKNKDKIERYVELFALKAQEFSKLNGEVIGHEITAVQERIADKNRSIQYTEGLMEETDGFIAETNGHIEARTKRIEYLDKSITDINKALSKRSR